MKITVKNTYLSLSEIQNNVKKLSQKGIKILAGTDSPNLGLNYTTDYFDELELLNAAGLSNLEVLRSATTNIYSAFKLTEFTRLTAGAQSNFILIDGDPTHNISEIRNSKTIYKNGLQFNSQH